MVMQDAFVVRMRTFREGDLMRLRLVLPILLLPAILAAGCAGGDDQDDTLPPVDGNPTSSNSTDTNNSDDGGGNKPSDDPIYSPAPKGAKLPADERAAYEAAVKDLQRWQAIEGDLKAKPRVDKQMQRMLVRWTYNPYTTKLYKLIRTFKSQGVRQVGDTEVFWRVPISVDLDARDPKVEWRECWGEGTMKFLRDGKKVKRKLLPPQETRVLMIADEQGRWHVSKAKEAGECGA